MKINIAAKPASTINNKTGGWRTFVPRTDYSACIGCGTCAKICPEGCVKMTKADNKQKPDTDYDFCKGCGLCAAECPVRAIKMELEEK